MDQLISFIFRNIFSVFTGVFTLGACYVSWRVWQSSTDIKIERLAEKHEEIRQTMQKLVDRLDAMERRDASRDTFEAVQMKTNEQIMEVMRQQHDKHNKWIETFDKKFDALYTVVMSRGG